MNGLADCQQYRPDLADMIRTALHVARGTENERAELQVTSAEVEVPAQILRLGFEFIDTPGVGSAIEISTATTRQFLPQAVSTAYTISWQPVLGSCGL